MAFCDSRQRLRLVVSSSWATWSNRLFHITQLALHESEDLVRYAVAVECAVGFHDHAWGLLTASTSRAAHLGTAVAGSG
jgi:hypothetical protein